MSENKEESIKAQIKSLIKGDSRDNTEETKKVEQKEKDNKENTKKSKENNDKILVLLYAKWCGHCRDF
jgi:thiol-disulfide isomerase/thioredoxin